MIQRRCLLGAIASAWLAACYVGGGGTLPSSGPAVEADADPVTDGEVQASDAGDDETAAD